MSKVALVAVACALSLFASCTSYEYWRETGSNVPYMAELEKLAFTAFTDKGGKETTELQALRWRITEGIRQYYEKKGLRIEMIEENALFQNYAKHVEANPDEVRGLDVSKFDQWVRSREGIKAQVRTIVSKYGEGSNGFEIGLDITVVDHDGGGTKSSQNFLVFAETRSEAIALMSRYLAEALLNPWVRIEPVECERRPTDVEREAGTGPPSRT